MRVSLKSALGTLLMGALMSGVAFAKLAPVSTGACAAADASEVSASMFEQPVVHISVTYETEDGSLGEPVPGVYVFDARTNRLYGRTADNGRLDLSVAAGTVLRIVEPIYGQQQHVTEPVTQTKTEPVVWTRPK